MIATNSAAERTDPGAATVFVTRLVTALVQAAALYCLIDAEDAPRSWPATEPWLFVPMLLAAAYVPFIVLQGVAQIRIRPLVIWLLTATALIAGLGYHDVARGRMPAFAVQDALWPSSQLSLALAAGLFIAHVLVVDAIQERRWVPSYTRHFDSAWKMGVQVVLAAVFAGVFWGVLTLGAGLFKLVDVTFFVRLIQHRWFAIPATTVALAVAVHVTDVQPALIRGARSLALTLFSWLLPLLAAILCGFLGILPFISLAPLWKTHFATALLIVAAGALIFLINCCYQDGAAEKVTSRIRRLAATAGAIELLPLAGLAVWGLSLRVGQYGWSTERVFAAAVTLVVCCYAAGYASATVLSREWLRRVEITNVVTAWVVLALFLALFSPLADPARLMVADQLARLRSGAVRPEKFDFVALKFDGARWGGAALAELSRMPGEQPDAAVIRAAAANASQLKNRYAALAPGLPTPTAEEIGKRVDVYPTGPALPPVFDDAAVWALPGGGLPYCFRPGQPKCTAFFVTLHPGEPEALMVFGFIGTSENPVFEQDGSGHWRKTGQLLGAVYCGRVRQGLEHGQVAVVPHAWPDPVIGGQSMVIAPPLTPECGGTAPARPKP